MPAECTECGETPWLTVVDGDFFVRCKCGVGVSVDSVEHKHYVPANWEPSSD